MPIAKLMCICSAALSGFVSPSVHSITNSPSFASLPPSQMCTRGRGQGEYGGVYCTYRPVGVSFVSVDYIELGMYDR